MNLRLIPAITLALLATTSSAATRYDFSYTGLYYDRSWDDVEDGFYTDAAITGFFVGEDTNGDGTFEAGELTDFAFGYNYGLGGELIHVIGPEVPEYCLRCEIQNFDYTPGGTLVFNTWLSGVRFQQLFSNTQLWSEWYSDYWTLTVTPDTIIRVTEVPEPATGIMLTSGLIGLACLRRRPARPTNGQSS